MQDNHKTHAQIWQNRILQLLASYVGRQQRHIAYVGITAAYEMAKLTWWSTTLKNAN